MRQPNFGRPLAPLVAQHLHDDAVDGLENEGVHHGLQVELELKRGDPLSCRWRVPLLWAHNPSGVLAFYRDQLDA